MAQTLERDGFTRDQVIAALHAPNRRIDFRYELLDKDGAYLRDLPNVLGGSVSHDSTADIKRTARFTLKDDGDIDFMSDRIRPIMRVYVPNGKAQSDFNVFYSQQYAPVIRDSKVKSTGGWAEFKLGEFLLLAAPRKETNGGVIRDVIGYDGLLVLRDDKLTERLTLTAGTLYHDAVLSLLQGSGIAKVNVAQTVKTLPIDLEFEIGATKLSVVNELLRAINYEPIHVDVNGYYISAPYRNSAQRSAEYTYVTDSTSVTYGGYVEDLDTVDIPNKWVVICSNPDQALVSTYTNNNPDSPTSTVNRGRTIVKPPVRLDDIADQESLDAYTERIAFESSQVFGMVEFETALMPMHDYEDVLRLEFADLGISGKYTETHWSMALDIGAKMRHEARRVVTI